MQENKRILRITGKGESASAPDTTIISLNISGEDKNYQKAMENADNAVMKLKNALTRAGFDEKKITTEDFRVQTVNKYVKKLTEEKYVFDKYRVSNYLQIKFEFNTKKLAKCVDVIVDSTSEPNFNIDFSVENTEKLKEKALTNAVENATRQAKILSKSAGVSLEKLCLSTIVLARLTFINHAQLECSMMVRLQRCQKQAQVWKALTCKI